MKKQTNLEWHVTPLGILTRIIDTKKHKFNDNKKAHDKIKIEYNRRNCVMLEDLDRFIGRIVSDASFRCLVIDALFLKTTTALVESKFVRLSDIDIVSNSIAFCKQTARLKTGALFSGPLSDFLHNAPIPKTEEERYDVLVLDFCGASHVHLDCLSLLFEKLMIADLAVGSITFSYRAGPNQNNKYTKQEKIDATNVMFAMAVENGYSIRFYEELEEGTMFSLFFKIIHNVGALSNNGGFLQTKDKGKEDASNWLNKSFLFCN